MSYIEYQANAFHQQFERGRTFGTLLSQPGHFIFRWDGEREVVFPHDRLVFRLGGNNNRLIFLEHPQHPGWSLYTSDKTLLKDPNLLGDTRIAQLAKQSFSQKRNFVLILSTLLLLICGSILGLMAARPWLVSRLAEQVPVSWEEKWGTTIYEQYRNTLKPLEDEALNQALDAFAAPLIEAVQRQVPFKVHLEIVEDAELNAFALPGGFVVLNSGSILAADSAEEVYGLLGHEIAHVAERHQIRSIINSVGLVLLLQTFIGDSSALLALISEAAPYLLRQQFSREQESQADATAIRFLQSAHIDPIGLVRFFEKIKAQQNDIATTMEDKLNFLSTHPATDARIRAIHDLLETQPDVGFNDHSQRFQELKARLRSVLKTQIGEGENQDEDNH